MTKNLRYLLFFIFGITLFAQSAVSLPSSFKASFKQTITNDQKKQIIYNGKVLFSAPDQFKWSYHTPNKKEVCTDGARLEVVDHDLEQVSTYMMDKGLDLPAILKSAKLHRPSVYIARYGGKNYTIQVNKREELSRIAFKDELDNSKRR